MLGVGVPTIDLEIAAAAYERQVSELVGEDDETITYVEQLEERFDEDQGVSAAGSLVEEVEQFLRSQREQG